MRRIRSITKEINLKYLFTEICLIFIGISLAIWFNNWNVRMQTNQDKAIVLERVREEITKNLDELKDARKTNQRTADAYLEYRKYYGADSDEVLVSSMKMKELQAKYPSFFIVIDSVRKEIDHFGYVGETHIDLELVELSEIAWKTAQTLNVANELSYDCLYDLESIYNLQSKVMEGFDMIKNSLGDGGEMSRTFRWLSIVDQLDSQLEIKYKEVLAKLDDCR